MSVLKQINRMRKDWGLPPIIQKKVKCLTCEKMFTSVNYPANRVCKKCKDSASWQTDLNIFNNPQCCKNINKKTPAEILWAKNIEIENENEV